MRYACERRDGSWVDIELTTARDAAEVADSHKSPVIEIAWVEPGGRAAIDCVYCCGDAGRRSVEDITRDIQSTIDHMKSAFTEGNE